MVFQHWAGGSCAKMLFCLSSLLVPVSAEDSVAGRLRTGSHLFQEGNYAGAILAFQSVLDDASLTGKTELTRAQAYHRLGWAYSALDQDQKAQAAYRRAEAILSPLAEFHYPYLLRLLESEADLEVKRRQYPTARALMEHAESIVVRLAPDDRLEAANLSEELAAIDQLDGKADRAAARHRKALEVIEAAVGRQSGEWKRVANNLAVLLLISGKRNDARRYIDEALRGRESLAGIDRVTMAKFLLTRFDVYFASGQKREAERDVLEALEIFQAQLGPSNRLTAEALRRCGDVSRALGHKAEAREYERRAKESMDGSPSVQQEKNTVSASELARVSSH